MKNIFTFTNRNFSVGLIIIGIILFVGHAFAQPTRNWGTYYGGSNIEITYECTTDANGNVYFVGYSISSANISTPGSHQPVLAGGQDGMLVKMNSAGVCQWATYYGGAGMDHIWSVAVDANGNVFIAGRSDSPSGISTAGSHQAAIGGGTDAFVAKFNGAGVRQWATYYGGAGDEIAYNVAVDASGNVFVSGSTTSSTGISTPGSYLPLKPGGIGNQEVFIVKFDNSGVRQWGTYYGGTGGEGASGMAVDGSGNVYIGGSTSSFAGISTPGAQQVALSGTSDAFLAKFDNAGTLQWGTYYGGLGTNGDAGNVVCTDAGGNVYLAGYTNSTSNIGTAGSHQPAFAGGYADGFLVKFNGSGVRQWGTYYGGCCGDDELYGLAADAAGNIYIGGYSADNNGIATPGSYQPFPSASADCFLVKFSSGGVRQWGTYYGGNGVDYTNSIAVDANNKIYLLGYCNSTSSISTAGCYQPTNAGGSYDGFLVQFDGCITAPTQPAAVSGNTNSCQGSATIYSVAPVNGATSYGWNLPGGWSGASATNVISATPGSSGILTVTAINSCGTSLQQTLNITANAPPTVSVNSGSICSGASFTLVPGGANTYTFQGGGAVVSPTANATYTVIGTNSLGCSSTNTAISSITVNPLPNVSVNSGSICSGNSFTMVPGGANTYSIEGGGTVVTPTASTSFTVIGTSAVGCMSSNTATANITVNALPTISVNSGSICSGQSFTMVPSGANTYTFQGGGAIVSPTTNNSYTVIGTSTAGCLSSNTVISNVTVNVTPTISVNSGSICSGNSFTMVPSGANTYTIQGGSAVVSPTITSSYTVSGTSAAGCVSNTFATSNVTVNLTPTITVNSGSICSGNSFTIVPGGANTYTFQGGNAIVNPTTNASYTVTGTSTAGCVSSNTATSNITVNATPTIVVAGGAICQGGSFTLSPSGANTYSYSGGSQIVSPTVTTTYSVSGTSTAGCVSIGSSVATVTVSNTLTVTITGNNTVCLGSAINFTAGGAATYTWNTGATTTTIAPTPSVNTTYSVSGASGSCTSTAVKSITVNPLPLITLNSSHSSVALCIGQTATLTASGANTYSWNTGSNAGSILISPTITTNYTVTGLDANGCSSTATITQVVTDCTGLSAIVSGKEQTLIIYPNPFSNKITVTSSRINQALQIYNLIGAVVYNSAIESEKTEVDLSHYPNGIYLIKIGSITKKIIKE